jgi:hypothetical protein
MPLNPTDDAKARAWLSQHLNGCHNCGSKSLTVEEILQPPIRDKDEVISLLTVICAVCAYAHFFGAKKMGLL